MNINHHILHRYFLGDCSEEEKESIRQWLESDESHMDVFIRERIRFDASIVIDENKILQDNYKNRRRRILNTLKIASIIVLLIGCGYFFTLYQLNKPQQTLQHIYVPAASRTCVTLTDGTQVWVNSNTSFSYPNIFPDKKRIVELDGEAFFEVNHDQEKAFIVKTHKYNIEVLGTTFNVEAYKKENAFKTSLFSGRVKLYKEIDQENSLYLNPGETAELIDDVLHVSTISDESYRWKDGLIILEGKSFDQIMRLFEKYFDLQIIINNEKVKGLGYNGKLRIADGVDHALRVLQKDFRFTYKREEESNIIYINP